MFVSFHPSLIFASRVTLQLTGQRTLAEAEGSVHLTSSLRSLQPAKALSWPLGTPSLAKGKIILIHSLRFQRKEPSVSETLIKKLMFAISKNSSSKLVSTRGQLD